MHARAAFVWDATSGEGHQVAAFDANFGPGGNCQAAAFAVAGQFRGVILCRERGGDDPTTYETADYATALEAQDAVRALLATDAPYGNDLPLVMLVLRNDGRIDVAGAVLAIDAVNVGRSYLYQEVRPWLHVHLPGGPA